MAIGGLRALLPCPKGTKLKIYCQFCSSTKDYGMPVMDISRKSAPNWSQVVSLFIYVFESLFYLLRTDMYGTAVTYATVP